MDHFLKQNNSVDIYEEYFCEEESLLTDEPPTARTISVLKYINNNGITEKNCS